MKQTKSENNNLANQKAQAKTDLLYGVILIIIGGLITLASYAISKAFAGGVYLVFYIPIAVGIALIVRSIYRSTKLKMSEEK